MTHASLPTRGLPPQQLLAAEAVNQLMGVNGTPGGRALRVDDLVNLGLVRLDSSGNLHKTELFEQLTRAQQAAADPADVADLQEAAAAFDRELSGQGDDIEDLRTRLQLALAHNALLTGTLEQDRQNIEDLRARIANAERLGELLRQNTEKVHSSLGSVIESVGNIDNVPHGDDYGRASNLDLLDYDNLDGSGLVRRVGLRVPGGQRIADQRNLPQSAATAYGSVRTRASLSADEFGNVSVISHNVRYGSVSIHYSAVDNAVTGLAAGSTYVIYCFDEAYEGGVRLWFAGLNPSEVMNLGDGVVVAGQITIPLTGSGSGGNGGDGTDPEEWCVDYDSVLPDGRLVRELREGDLVECIDVRTGKVGMFPLLALSIGEAECFALVTPSLAEVWQSRATMMDMPDGGITPTMEMFGKPVYEKVDGSVRLTLVTDVRFLGRRKVCRPDLGDRMFFAGTTARATLGTHNMRAKV